MRAGVNYEEAAQIKARLAAGEKPEDLAQEFRVSEACILSFVESETKPEAPKTQE